MYCLLPFFGMGILYCLQINLEKIEMNKQDGKFKIGFAISIFFFKIMATYGLSCEKKYDNQEPGTSKCKYCLY